MATLIHWQDPATFALAVIRLDSLQSENAEDKVTITDHPVELGANVVDHAREEPTILTIEGMVSSIPNPRIDTDSGFQVMQLSVPVMSPPGTKTIKLDPPKPPLELSPNGLLQAGVGALVSAVTGGPNLNATFRDESRLGSIQLNAQLYQQNSPRNRVREVYEALLAALQARQLVSISTRDREYFDMMIERVSKPRAVEDGSSAKFQIDFKHIRVASSQTVAAPKPTEARGKGPVNKGSQAAKKKEDPKPFKSIAAALDDSGFHLNLGG